MIPLSEDFNDIKVRLEMLEREKLKALTVPFTEAQLKDILAGALPNVAPAYDWAPSAGYVADFTDFDPA